MTQDTLPIELPNLATTFLDKQPLESNAPVSKVGVDLLAETALFSITFHFWGNRRQADTTPKDKFTSAIASERLHSTMTLIKSDAYDAIKTYLTEARKWFIGRCMPSYLMKGIFFVKLTNVPDFEAKVDEVQGWLRNVGVPALLADYKRAKTEAKYDFEQIAAEMGIRSLFNESEYPTDEKLTGAFGISHSWLSFEVPKNLPEDIRKQEQFKMETKFAAAEQEIIAALREMFGTLVEHAVERLTPKPNGQDKIFKAATIDNFKEFFETFSSRNLTNDTELEQLVNQAKDIVGNLNPETIRKNQGIRQTVVEKLEVIKDAVDQLIVDRPTRFFDFDLE